MLLEDTTTESMLFVTFIVITFNLWIIMDGVDGFIIKKCKIFLKNTDMQFKLKCCQCACYINSFDSLRCDDLNL